MPAAFQSIPVIDLMAGRVVHARRGDRAAYGDLVSPLCATCRADDVVDGLLAVHPFTCLYVADLDAIMGHGHHAALLADIRDQHPALELWIDAGIRGYEDYTAWRQRRLGRIVIGSESLREADLFERLAREGEAPVLSLDYRGEAALGAAALFADPSRWPEDVIVMTLGRVGSGAGPDRQRLDAIRELAGGRRIYAAGGVRHGDDLAALQRSGIAGALIATALHSGAIGRAQLGALPSG